MFLNNRASIRNPSAEISLFIRRALIAFTTVLMLVLVLMVNLYQIQIKSHEAYQTRANGNRIKVIPVAPNRGLIFDRNGILLAENRPVHSLELVSEQIDDIEATVEKISQIISLTIDEKSQFFKSVKAQRRFKSIALKNKLTSEQVAKLSVNLHLLPGVSIEARLKRYYPFGASLTHVVGYVAKITKKEQQTIIDNEEQARYAATRDIGKQGIEKYYQRLLHGQAGYQEVEVNNRGRIIRVLNYHPPVHGQDLFLNIDIRLQQQAFNMLDGRRGAVVAIDPNNGAVLALVTSPSYDPNLFVHGISTKEYKKLLSRDKPLINRATLGAYPPASTVKPLLALAALENQVISETSYIQDPGWFKLPNVERKFKDHLAWGHGKVNLYRALEKSCNTFFYDLAYRLGIDKISEFMYKFGFGDYTGIDIHEEVSAIMPSRTWKKNRYNQPWYIGDTISLGIGQSYWTVTPLQLANSVAMVASNGKSFTPQILGASQSENGLLQIPAQQRSNIVLNNNDNWRIIHQGMWNVNNSPGGTAFKIFKDAPYASAGKTGTAQVASLSEDVKYDKKKIKERLRDNAIYVGYAPFQTPEIAISVAIENAGHGGSSAAPIARSLFDIYLDKNTSGLSSGLLQVKQKNLDKLGQTL
ncbi:MAG: penicillin-binding protein 2 [Gammaproteobacteria bacterium]|nr:penicillin-binding protein 2 [Gammaproteobacteria bacterium]